MIKLIIYNALAVLFSILLWFVLVFSLGFGSDKPDYLRSDKERIAFDILGWILLLLFPTLIGSVVSSIIAYRKGYAYGPLIALIPFVFLVPLLVVAISG